MAGRRATILSMQIRHLANHTEDDLARICERHGIQELALFGSALTETFGEESDLDVLVTFQPQSRPGFLTLARVQRDLEELFRRKVDLVPKTGLKPAIREAVLATAETLYARAALTLAP
jgi:predicted nucleotidyltransferase